MVDDIFSSVKIISVTALLRDFGSVAEELPYLNKIILTKGGMPFATLKASREEKRKLLVNCAGAWADTELDNAKFWTNPLTRRSKKAIPKL